MNIDNSGLKNKISIEEGNKLIRHKWEDNVCVRCGIKREMKTWKLRMAIVGNRDYYQYGRQYYYTLPNKQKGSFVRPNCNQNNQTK